MVGVRRRSTGSCAALTTHDTGSRNWERWYRTRRLPLPMTFRRRNHHRCYGASSSVSSNDITQWTDACSRRNRTALSHRGYLWSNTRDSYCLNDTRCF